MDGLTRALVSAGDIVESRTETFQRTTMQPIPATSAGSKIYRRGVAVAEAASRVRDLIHASTADAADATRVLGEALAQLHEVDHRGACRPRRRARDAEPLYRTDAAARRNAAQANRCAERMEHIASTLAAAGTLLRPGQRDGARRPTGRSRLRTSEPNWRECRSGQMASILPWRDLSSARRMGGAAWRPTWNG